MLIIDCDYHPGFQQIAFVDRETGDHDRRFFPLPAADTTTHNIPRGKSPGRGPETVAGRFGLSF